MYKNEKPIMLIIMAKIASMTRIPVLSKSKNINTSQHVIKIAAQIGILKLGLKFILICESIKSPYNPFDNKLSATAEPTTCCMSDAIIAISIMIHKKRRVNNPYSR